jgi:hypothetical protein
LVLLPRRSPRGNSRLSRKKDSLASVTSAMPLWCIGGCRHCVESAVCQRQSFVRLSRFFLKLSVRSEASASETFRSFQNVLEFSNKTFWRLKMGEQQCNFLIGHLLFERNDRCLGNFLSSGLDWLSFLSDWRSQKYQDFVSLFNWIRTIRTICSRGSTNSAELHMQLIVLLHWHHFWESHRPSNSRESQESQNRTRSRRSTNILICVQ